jgi:asparagine synthase (glutamine-hydrolysing)
VFVHGYCASGVDQILARLGARGVESLTELEGEYVLVIEGENERWLVSSARGFEPYFYAERGGNLFHGLTVGQVIASSGLAWSWNPRAVADFLRLDHLVGDASLHPEVRRLPAATVLHHRTGRRATLAVRPWSELHREAGPDPQRALDALLSSVARWLDGDTALAMSSGFDSRLLLAACLRLGHRPELLVMGEDDSTDVLVSRAIARSFGLPLRSVKLDLSSFVDHAPRIVELTSGTKSALHWHSYVFPLRAGLPRGRTVLVGTNGEWARSDYLNLGLLSRSVDVVARPPLAAAAHRAYWSLKPRAPLRPEEIRDLSPELRAELALPRREVAARLAALCQGDTFLGGLDRFFTGERVRNFHSNGLRLYGAHVSPRMPFLSRDWMTAVAALPRRWKLGSAWHRWAIQRLAPRLLDFPEGARSPRTSPTPPLLYWAPPPLVPAPVPYADYDRILRRPELLDLLAAQARSMTEQIPSSVVMRIVEEQRRGLPRTGAVAALLALTTFAGRRSKPGERVVPEGRDQVG